MEIDPVAYARRQRHVHGPDWRWRLAQALAGGAPHGTASPTDPQVLEACAYLQQRAGGPEQGRPAPQQFAHIAAAEALSRDRAVCDALKVLVLGNCAPAAIAERLRLDVNSLATWESLFFDVRAAREVTDWILEKVIRPEQERGDDRLASRLKFACAGGPVAALAILDAEARLSVRAGVTLFDRKLRLDLRFVRANQLPLKTDREKLRLLKMDADLMYREQRLRLAGRRLEQKSQEALRKQAAAERRRARALERQRERAAQAAAKEAERARKRDERRASELRREVARLARAEARRERRQAAKERSATSALAQLRWEFADPPPACTGHGPSGGTVQELPGVLCGSPEDRSGVSAPRRPALGAA